MKRKRKRAEETAKRTRPARSAAPVIPRPPDVQTTRTTAPCIKAEVHSDDRVFEIPFDAVAWFKQAKPQKIVDLAGCDWGGDYPADAVAEFMEDHVPEIAQMFRYLERIHDTPHSCGFECHVNKVLAVVWLEANRPAVAERIAAQHSKENPPVRTIGLPCFDIVVRLGAPDPEHPGAYLNGQITSSLHEGKSGSEDESEYETAIDGIESLILAHACAGVGIAAPAYVEGVQTAVEAAIDHL